MDDNPSQTVYFRDFPEDFTSDSAKTVFSEFGNIVKCFIHKSNSGSYGMVQFDDVSSCMKAIDHLSGQPPLNLFLNMVKNNEKHFQKPKKYVSYDREADIAVTYIDEEFYVDENNELVNILKDPLTNEIYVPIRYATNIRCIIKKVPKPVNQPINNGFVNNGNVSDNDDTASDLSLINARRINFNPRSHDLNIIVQTESDSSKGNKNQNHLQTGEHKIRRNIRKPSGSQSSNSGDEGKRAKLQGGDNNKIKFPKKDFNNKPTVSAKGDDNFGNSQTTNNKFKPYNKFFKISDKGDCDFNDPQASSNNKVKSHNKLSTDEGDWDNEAEQKPQSTPTNKPSFSKNFKSKQSKEREQSAIVEQKPQHSSRSAIEKKPQISSRSTLSKMFKNNPTYKCVELPPNQLTQVKVEHAESETKGWVQICSMIDEFALFMEKILIYLSTNNIVVEPEVGLICLANFEDNWFRALVLKTFPKVYVRFIDYGNESIVDGNILGLPKDLQNVPAFAVCINLANGAPCKLKNEFVLKVKPVKMENGVVEVHVENGIYEREEQPVNPLSLCQESMMKILKPSTPGIFQGVTKISDTEGVGFFLPNSLDDDILSLDKITSAVENDPNIKAKVGDLIAAQNEGWNRGIVLNITDGYKVAFIDFGLVKTVKSVKSLPEEFHNIPQFTCFFFSKQINKLVIDNVNPSMTFEITKIVNGVVHCNVNCEGGIVEISFVLWDPIREAIESAKSDSACAKLSEEKLAPLELKLKTGDDCKIVHLDSQFIFVRTREGSELLKKVDNYISDYAQQAQKLTEEPVVGQYVAAQYNGTWYRAVVTNVKPNAANILFIDYGNEEVKPFFSLKILDEKCLQYPCTAIKIKLRGFVENKFSQKCIAYLNNFDTKQILKASFKTSPENGVDLTTKDGRNISNELLKVEQEPANKSLRREPYMSVKVPGNEDERITSFDIERIPCGQTEVKFLAIIDLSNYTISVSPTNPEMLHRIHVELLTQITKYANSAAPKLPYLPVEDEIVLVAHGVKWYRGLTLEVLHNNEIQIYLVDYGFVITATSEELRKIPAEFIDDYKFLASFATIQGLPPSPSTKLIDRLQNYFVKNEIYEVEVLKEEDQTYDIVVPDLLQQLKSENFI